jgi:hypothetical protein
MRYDLALCMTKCSSAGFSAKGSTLTSFTNYWALQLQPLNAAFRHAQTISRIRAPMLFDGSQAPLVSLTYDVKNHLTSLHAKVIARCFCPGQQPRKFLMRAALTRAAPHPRWGAAWVLCDLPLTACGTLSPHLRSLVNVFNARIPDPLKGSNGDPHPLPARLLEHLYFNPPPIRNHLGHTFDTPPISAAHHDWP